MKKCLLYLLILSLFFTSCATKSGSMDEIWNDGVYEGEGEPNKYGNELAIVTIKMGKIFSIELKSLDKDGKEKDYNMYNGSNTDEKGEVYPNLKYYKTEFGKDIVDNQDVNKSDAISGATITTKNWKLAIRNALDKARRDNKKAS